MPSPSKWLPAYPDLPRNGVSQDDPSRVYRTPRIRVGADDARTLVAAAADNYILTYICQHAIRNAAQFCRDNGITYANVDPLLDHIRERSAPCDTAEAAAHDDGRGRTPRDSRVATIASAVKRARTRAKGSRGSEESEGDGGTGS